VGVIRRPFVEVQLFARQQKTWIPVESLVDSGADYTMLPRRYADILGIDVNIDCSAIRTSGVGALRNRLHAPVIVDKNRQLAEKDFRRIFRAR